MAENNVGNDDASAMRAYAAAAADAADKSSHGKPSPKQVDEGVAAVVAETPAVVIVSDASNPLDAASAPALKPAKPRKAAPSARGASAVPPRRAKPALVEAPAVAEAIVAEPDAATPVAATAAALMSSAAKLAETSPLPSVEPIPAETSPLPVAEPTPVMTAPRAESSAEPSLQAVEYGAPLTQSKLTQLKRPSLFSAKPKEKIMETTSTYADNFKQKISETQDKAKEALEKGRAAFGEVREFSRGNLDAVVASGKILVGGLRDMGGTLVAERRAALETLKADFNDLTTAKTPTDFFKLQGEIARKNLDSMVATGSKNSEAVLKLTREAMAPISGRLSLAVEKVKSARA